MGMFTFAEREDEWMQLQRRQVDALESVAYNLKQITDNQDVLINGQARIDARKKNQQF